MNCCNLTASNACPTNVDLAVLAKDEAAVKKISLVASSSPKLDRIVQLS